VVDVSNLSGLTAALHHEQIADVGGRRDQSHEPRSVFGRAIILHRVVATSDFRWFAESSIELHQVGFPLLRCDRDHAFAVSCPDYAAAAAPTRRALVAAHSPPHLEA